MSFSDVRSSSTRYFGLGVARGNGAETASGLRKAFPATAATAPKPTCCNQRRRDCQTSSGVISDGAIGGMLALDMIFPLPGRYDIPHVTKRRSEEHTSELQSLMR